MPQAVEVKPEPDFDVLLYLEAVESAYVDSKTHTIDHETTTSTPTNQDAGKFVQSAEKYERMVPEDHTVIENVHPPGDIRVTTQNEKLHTLTNGIPCKLERGRFSATLELPKLFHPLVLMVAGLRPVKVRGSVQWA